MKPRNKNYEPESMDFMSGFLGPQGDVGFFMIADFDKAKKIVKKLISKGKEIDRVLMGLDGDWYYNSMIIYENEKFKKYDCHEGSEWAEPIILVEFKDCSNETYSVWFREIEVPGKIIEATKFLN